MDHNSFLGLVLFGVKPWNDQTVLNSLAVGDSQLAADTPSGRIWHRFTHDGYGEKRNGQDWNIFENPMGQTLGRVWPPRREAVAEGTRSATPLAWTHAQFVRLAWSIAAGEPIRRPAIVACRYTGQKC